MKAKKGASKKAIKDLKPKKSAARKVKGGLGGRGPLADLENKLNKRVPDPF